MNNLMLILSAVFCLVPILNMILPDYYNYIVRMSYSTPIKNKYDFLYIIFMFIEIIYILLGFTTPLASIFILLIAFEVMCAVGLTMTDKRVFYIYSVIFFILNLFIFVELYGKII